MEHYLANLEALYSDDDQVVYQAILAKKDWMFRPLFLAGNFTMTIDQNGKEHFPFIEALFDDVLLFNDLIISEKLCKNKKQRDKINKIIGQQFAKITFHGDINNNENTPHFYIEYDFAKIDQKGYQALVANFFPCFENINIDKTKLESSLVEQIKVGIIGKTGDFCLIIDKSQLLNNAFYAPVMKKVIVHKYAPKEVKDVLKQLTSDKEIIYEEADYE